MPSFWASREQTQSTLSLGLFLTGFKGLVLQTLQVRKLQACGLQVSPERSPPQFSGSKLFPLGKVPRTLGALGWNGVLSLGLPPGGKQGGGGLLQGAPLQPPSHPEAGNKLDTEAGVLPVGAGPSVWPSMRCPLLLQVMTGCLGSISATADGGWEGQEQDPDICFLEGLRWQCMTEWQVTQVAGAGITRGARAPYDKPPVL